MVDFPNNPQNLDLHTEEGATWVYREPPGAWAILVPDQVIEPIPIAQSDNAAGIMVWGETMLQWRRDTSVSGGSDIVFPTKFADVPVVTTSSVNGNRMVQVSAITEAQMRLRCTDQDGTTQTTTVLWIAMGEAPDDMKKVEEVPYSALNAHYDEHVSIDPINDYSWRITGDTLECWGRVSITPTTADEVEEISVALPKSYSSTNFDVFATSRSVVNAVKEVSGRSDATNRIVVGLLRSSTTTTTVAWRTIGKWDGVT